MIPQAPIFCTFVGDGTTTAFHYDKRIYLAADLQVWTYTPGVDTVPQQMMSGYTVAVDNDFNGAVATLTVAPAVGVKVGLIRRMDLTQDINISNTDYVPPSLVEQQMDRQVMMAQEAALFSTLQLKSDPFGFTTAARANGAPVFDANGNQTFVLDPFPMRGAWSSATAYNYRDVVTRNGTAYISRTANTNIDPATDNGTNWQILGGDVPLDPHLISWQAINRATGFDAFVAAPSSANFEALLTDHTRSAFANSIVALQALDVTKTSAAVLTLPGRGGTFVFNSSNLASQVTNDPQQGVYIAPASAPTGASGAWVRQYSRLSVEYFGASTSATAAANTTAIQAAVNFAQLYTGYLFFPALYSINGTITVSNNVVLEGVSAFTSGITTTTGAAISLVPSTLISNNNTWYGFRYLSIISTDVGAHYGIEYASTGSEYLSNWELVGCYLSGTSGGTSFDSTGSTVGIFSCTIRRNWFDKGCVIKDGGDSITFVENTVNGAGIGLLVNALKTGARQLVIRNNNFSALSECVYLLNVTGAFVDSNWMETPSYLGSYTGTTGALMYAQACSNLQITRNTIQPLASVGGGFVPAAYAIRLNTSGNFNVVAANQLIAIGGTGHIQIGGGVTNTYIDWGNNFDVTAVITDAGTGTFGAGSSPGIYKQLVSFQTATQFTAVIQALCTDSGTGNGPYYEIYRQKAAGAANDGIGGFLWYGSNSAGAKTNYGYITHTILTATAGSEAGQFNIARMVGGALTTGFTLGAAFAFTTGGTFNGTITPLSNGSGALGSAALQWSNVFLANGGVINFNNGNYTVTHTSGTLTFSGAVLSSGAGGIGYATGAGGTVAQATSRTTGVTLNKPSGAITMFTAAGSATPASFTVTNSTVAATDTIVLNIKSGATNTYFYFVTAVAAGSFVVTFWTTGGTASDAPVLTFNVIKGVMA